MVETQQQHLVETRAVAHDLGLRIDRPSKGLLAVERQVARLQRLRRSRGGYRDQQIAFFRAFPSSLGLRQGEAGRQRKAQPQLDCRTPPDSAHNAREVAIHPVLQHELAPASNRVML